MLTGSVYLCHIAYAATPPAASSNSEANFAAMRRDANRTLMARSGPTAMPGTRSRLEVKPTSYRTSKAPLVALNADFDEWRRLSQLALIPDRSECVGVAGQRYHQGVMSPPKQTASTQSDHQNGGR
jgi:hypothetical protein